MAVGTLIFLFLASLVSALVAEGISYLTIFTSSKYKNLVDVIEKSSKRLEKIKEADALSGSKKSSKEIARMEEQVKSMNMELSMVKFKSTAAVTVTVIAFITLLNSWFEGTVVAVLPFEPFSLVTSLSHRTLPGDDYRECSMTFFYVLCSMCIRTTLQKILGTEPPKSTGSFFDAPK